MSTDEPVRFPTRLDRSTKTFFLVLAMVILICGVLLAEPQDGLLDGIVPSFLLVAFTWPQLYLMWRLYAHRRRQQIAEREAHLGKRSCELR